MATKPTLKFAIISLSGTWLKYNHYFIFELTGIIINHIFSNKILKAGGGTTLFYKITKHIILNLIYRCPKLDNAPISVYIHIIFNNIWLI